MNGTLSVPLGTQEIILSNREAYHLWMALVIIITITIITTQVMRASIIQQIMAAWRSSRTAGPKIINKSQLHHLPSSPLLRSWAGAPSTSGSEWLRIDRSRLTQREKKRGIAKLLVVLRKITSLWILNRYTNRQYKLIRIHLKASPYSRHTPFLIDIWETRLLPSRQTLERDAAAVYSFFVIL